MSKKHFKALAEALKSQRPAEHWCANKRTQWNLDVQTVARVCATTNDLFNYHRFIEACGGLFEKDGIAL